jgi:uncharacterized protein (TIGR04562 family)
VSEALARSVRRAHNGAPHVPAKTPSHELYHEIFGSILDRTEMTPYLFLPASKYAVALRQATRMLGNRGFDTDGADDLRARERERAHGYIRDARRYLGNWLFPFVEKQLGALAALGSANRAIYRDSLDVLAHLRRTFADKKLRRLVDEDPRHVLLLASSRRYPGLFDGYRGRKLQVPSDWQRMACALLKTAHLIKSIEEDSQDIHDYARLALFFQGQGLSLGDLFAVDWAQPRVLPDDEPAQRAFVKVSSFFHKLQQSMTFDADKGCYVFSSGDGVDVDILEVKARLKSPESMFTKLGKNREDEAYAIRDVLAITFLLKTSDDTLTLFHALQKRGVILQENVASHSITQTLFSSPDDMLEAVRRLTINLARSAGSAERWTAARLRVAARQFFAALSANVKENPDSSLDHRKFQCKINHAVPVHRDRSSGRILIPGTDVYAVRDSLDIETQQHTLPVELRISDQESWHACESKGEAHHDAYRLRQLLTLTSRLFAPAFRFPSAAMPRLRADQNRLFA